MTYRLIHGDCLDVMRTMDAGSVDAVVTDPPYGLGFMGKKWDEPGAMVERRAATENAWDHVGGNHNPTCSADSARTKRSEGVKFQKAMEAWSVEALRVAKPGAHLLAFGGTRTFHRLTCAIEDAGWEIRDCMSWLYGSGFPKSHNGAWGGTALKPAWEPVILARKPLVGTVAANYAAHGTGALNIDGCRIGTDERFNPPAGNDGTSSASVAPVNVTDYSGRVVTGRWPANVVLDEEAAKALDEQSDCHGAGAARDGSSTPRPVECVATSYNIQHSTGAMFRIGDSGGASRFFYVAKASRAEREAGLREAAVGSLNMRTDSHAKSNGNDTAPARNTHPTVKPVDLMRWLVRLVTPTGGIVLDPFTGSGSTGVAAIEEGCSFIGIEREAEYVAIAEARLKHASRAPTLPFDAPKPATPAAQLSLDMEPA